MEYQLYDSDELENESGSDEKIDTDDNCDEKFLQFVRYLISSSIIFIALFSMLIVIFLIRKGQKTRNPQQRRPYMGTRARPSLSPQEPTIYVSPANLPPPPKYEAMAPPSYDEVVGVHYPGYQPPVQPITTPIATAMAQTGNSSSHNYNNNNNQTTVNAPPTVITVTADSRTAVTVATT